MFEIFSGYSLSLYSKIALVMAGMNFVMALIVFLGGKDRASRIFTFVPIVYGLWIINHGIMHGLGKSAELQLFLLNNSNYLGVLSLTAPLLFSYSFPDNTKPPKIIMWVLAGYHTLMIPLYYLIPGFMVQVTNAIAYEPYWNWEYGKGGILFIVPFFLLWILTMVNLHAKTKIVPKDLQINIKFMFWTFFAGGIVPSIVSVLLPYMGFHNLSWLSSTFASAWIFIFGYSVVKFNQMSVRVVTTELLVFAAIFILFLSFFV